MIFNNPTIISRTASELILLANIFTRDLATNLMRQHFLPKNFLI